VQDRDAEQARGKDHDNTRQAREVVHEQRPSRYDSGSGD
jgi:hypothetical protein